MTQQKGQVHAPWFLLRYVFMSQRRLQDCIQG